MSNAGASKAKRNAVMALAALCIYGAVQLLALSGTLLSYHLQVLSLACINIMLVVSLNLITGFTGQFSLGHAGFMAIGAYLSAALTVFYQLPFLAVLVLSGVAAALVGIIIGLPALRLKGDYLAIATLGIELPR